MRVGDGEEEEEEKTKVGPPERDKTDGPQELNDGWVRRPLGAPTEYIEKRNCQSSSCRF
jgi:hypothetical protein